MALRLEKPDAEGQVYGHEPEFRVAGVVSIENIGQEDHAHVDVQKEQRREDQVDVTHLDDRVLTIGPNDGTHGIKDQGIDSCKGDVGDTKSVPVVVVSPVMAIGVEVHHVCG